MGHEHNLDSKLKSNMETKLGKRSLFISAPLRIGIQNPKECNEHLKEISFRPKGSRKEFFEISIISVSFFLLSSFAALSEGALGMAIG